MKTLNLHCDFIKFKALKKALKNIEEIEPGQKLQGESKDCLVVLTAVEKEDGSEVVKEYVESIKKIAKDVKVKNIVLYPYAHLSSNLSSPSRAISALKEAKELLSEFNVILAPFGYYKEFELKVKGHPLSELSREIKGKEEVKELSKEEISRLLREISKSKLDTSKLKENDHRIIGSKLDLWSFNNVAPGMVFWHPKGLHIKNKLIEEWRKIQRDAGYVEISTPQIMDRKIWEVSGHWSKYSENNFKTTYEKRDFLVKPMNCPGGMLVYKSSPKSYRDLPLRVAEMGIVHRVELSGVLAGLFRAIQFTQDDAHIFCKKEDLEKEVIGIIKLIEKILNLFNLKFDHVELSTRPSKRIGSKEEWDLSEKILEEILKKAKFDYKINKGEGAFYGPKIDFHLKDSLGRTWQTSTIQLDMSLPERFDLTYKDEDGVLKRPVMLHRVLYGSLERFIAIITEHLKGNFPLWLSPNQVYIITLNDSVREYAKKVFKRLFSEGFSVELNDKNETVGKKASIAQSNHFNYLLTIGEKELKSNVVAVRSRESKKIKEMEIEELISRLNEEIDSRSLLPRVV